MRRTRIADADFEAAKWREANPEPGYVDGEGTLYYADIEAWQRKRIAYWRQIGVAAAGRRALEAAKKRDAAALAVANVSAITLEGLQWKARLWPYDPVSLISDSIAHDLLSMARA